MSWPGSRDEFAEFKTTEEEFDRVMAEEKPLIVRKMTYSMPISEDLAMEYGLIPDTRPAPPPPTWRQRARWKMREMTWKVRWRLAAWIGGVPREDIEEASSLW